MSNTDTIKTVRKNKDSKTWLERSVQLNEKGLVKLEAGITLEDWWAQAQEKTDLQAAQKMQKAKADVLEWLNEPKRKLQT